MKGNVHYLVDVIFTRCLQQLKFLRFFKKALEAMPEAQGMFNLSGKYRFLSSTFPLLPLCATVTDRETAGEYILISEWKRSD